MKYYTQHGKPGAGQMDPTAWTETEAEGMEAAAVEHLIRIGPEARDFPLMVYVSDAVLRHDKGAPMCAHGFRFEVVKNWRAER